ncbi:hypothetical protein [Flavobacterium sp. FlaQc-48]|uniref:hypothetical protein n=1 Tax=Flavobacterium sp. FlaQc-48 TaxID=3374181 RepID=UPI003757BD72
MRTTTFVIILILICQQSIGQSTRSKVSDTIRTEKNLTETESTVVNIFLDAELKKDSYKYYKGCEIFIIEEALKTTKSIDNYLYSLEEWKIMNKVLKRTDLKKMYFLDSLQIKEIKLGLEKEQIYHWKVTDFKNIKVSLYKSEELSKSIRTGTSINLPKRLIIYFTKPLIINRNNALISFSIAIGESGVYSTITHFTVLLRKANNEWKDIGHYEDGVFY